jgi:hypothetical protein
MYNYILKCLRSSYTPTIVEYMEQFAVLLTSSFLYLSILSISLEKYVLINFKPMGT